jgi:hypothetical protein
MQYADASRRAGEAVRSAASRTPSGVPSWGHVLVTTIGLWTSRRLSGLRRPGRALLLVLCVLVLTAAAMGAVRLTRTSTRARAASGSASGSASASAGGSHAQARPARSAASGAGGAATATAAVRAQAAAWVAGQVSGNETIACDPGMCAALGAHGVAAGRLVPLGSGSGAPGAGVIAGSAAAGAARLGQEAPVLLASFGSGASAIDVRAVAPGGAAAYQAAVRADLAARRSGAAQLLHSRRLEVSAASSGQLQAGQVDSRLLVMLAMLASQRSWRVVAFGDGSPGVPLADAPYREVMLAATGGSGAAGAGGFGALAAALALVRAQRAPYQPVQVMIVRLAGGQPGLRIDFAAPSPLGLLSGGASR